MGPGCRFSSHNSTLDVAEPSSSEPVTAGMKANHQSVRPGESFDLVVFVRIAGGHHIYSTSKQPAPFSPTNLKLMLPAALEPDGDWVSSKPTITRAGESVYFDSASFRHRIKVRLNALETPLSIKVELRCQACTEELCWPPREIGVSTSVVVSKK
jgi:hypothetical protein